MALTHSEFIDVPFLIHFVCFSCDLNHGTVAVLIVNGILKERFSRLQLMIDRLGQYNHF